MTGLPPTKLCNSDFRFASAWIQGVDVIDSWNRFMAHRGSGDMRRVRSTMRTVLDQLASIAKRHGDPTVAGLLRRDPTRIKAPALRSASAHRGVVAAAPAAMPTLEEFAETLEDADFYSQAELVRMLEAKYGKVGGPMDVAGRAGRSRGRDTPEMLALKRKGRLVTRQLETLKRLEALAATNPVPDDPVDAWLDLEVAKRLRSVDVLKLSELLLYVRLHGYRWYRKVPRIGEEGAKRLMSWLRLHEGTLGQVAVTALAPRRRLDPSAVTPKDQFGVVPIERLRLPSNLSGADGTNRAVAERCKARARNDYAAVMEWLELRRPTLEIGNAHTFRAYRKEAERFLLWAVFERSKALSSLDHLDCLAYRQFIAAPGPAWIGEKSVPRWSEHWRPFEGPLGIRSRKAAETVVASMCSWLTDVRYLDSNPWLQVPKSNRPAPLQELRSLSDKQWALVDAWLQELPATAANERLRMMFSLALATGMREAELANARAGWLRQDVDEAGEATWNVIVLGKGSKEREVPLTARVIRELTASLAKKGLGASLAAVDADAPLLSGLRAVMAPMAPDRVYELMKDAFVRCAKDVEHWDPASAQRIRQASPHWLRHTHGRKFVEAGGDRGVLRQNLGHASDATTAIYDWVAAKRRRCEVEKVFG